MPPESLLDADQQQSLLYSSDLELGETTRLIFEAVERSQAGPRRARQPVGDPPAGAELAALPPADPGAEALLRPARRHRPDARRPHHRHAGQDRAQRRPRRDPAGGAGARLRRRAPAAARHQVSRPGLPRRLSTTSPSRPAACASSRAWSPPSTAPSFTRSRLAQRHRRSSTQLLGGGVERGSSTLILGPAGTGQVADRRCTSSPRPWRAARRRRSSSSTRSWACCSTAPRRWASTSRRCRPPAGCCIEQVDAAELSPGEFAHRVRDCVDAARHPHGRHRQPERLPGRHAGGALPGAAHPRAAAVPEPPGRHDLPDRRPARAGRRHEGAGRRHLPGRHRRSCCAISRPWAGCAAPSRSSRSAPARTRTRSANSASAAAASPSARRSSRFQGVLRGVPIYVGGGGPLLDDLPA